MVSRRDERIKKEVRKDGSAKGLTPVADRTYERKLVAGSPHRIQSLGDVVGRPRK
jgi:hypothetical protein